MPGIGTRITDQNTSLLICRVRYPVNLVMKTRDVYCFGTFGTNDQNMTCRNSVPSLTTDQLNTRHVGLEYTQTIDQLHGICKVLIETDHWYKHISCRNSALSQPVPATDQNIIMEGLGTLLITTHLLKRFSALTTYWSKHISCRGSVLSPSIETYLV